MKRLLLVWTEGSITLLKQQQAVVSDKLVSFNGKLPRKVSRQPRSLVVLRRWNANEFRVYMYTGMVAQDGSNK